VNFNQRTMTGPRSHWLLSVFSALVGLQMRFVGCSDEAFDSLAARSASCRSKAQLCSLSVRGIFPRAYSSRRAFTENNSLGKGNRCATNLSWLSRACGISAQMKVGQGDQPLMLEPTRWLLKLPEEKQPASNTPN
jgi:hypothetical protein